MTYKAIIFDFFDVIHSDSFHAWMNAHGLRREGKQAEASRLLDAGSITMTQFYDRLGRIAGQSTAEVKAEFDAAMRIDHEVVALIGELQVSFSVAVVSNSESDYLRAIIREHDLEHLFEHIVISAEVGHIKPNPEIFEHVLEKLKVEAGEAIFIDDSRVNVDAAKQLGITGIVFTGVDSLRLALKSLDMAVQS